MEGEKGIYAQVVDKVYPQIKDKKVGLLYESLSIILKDDESPRPEVLNQICDILGIKENANIEEDLKIIRLLLCKLPLMNLIPNKKLTLLKKPLIWFLDRLDKLDLSALSALIKKLFEKNQEEQEKIKEEKNRQEEIEKRLNKDNKHMDEKWIIILMVTIAGVIAGVPYCMAFVQRQQKKESNSTGNTENSLLPAQLTPPQTSPAALCLVVPARIASNLKVDSTLGTDEVKHLIGNSAYFLCIDRSEASSYEQLLELDREKPIDSDSDLEVYVKIEIDDGEDLIGQRIRYGLKTNLSAQAQCEVKEIAYLKTLSGMEKFNRI